MQQSHIYRSFRISTRNNNQTQSPGKSVHFRIERPVLDYYNKMSLNKQTKYVRIKHKSTADKERASLILNGSASQGNQEWRTNIGKYMKSKQHIQNRRGSKDLTFKFHQLDKTNRYIYIKKIADQAIPTHYVALTKSSLPPVRSDVEDISKSFAFNKSIPEESQPLEDTIMGPVRKGSQQLSHNRTYTDVQEHIMSNFISKYFKNKYRQTHKHEPENYLTHSLERYNTD